MSVEVLQELLAGVARRDLDGAMAVCREDVEIFSAMAPAEGGRPYVGHAGLEEWWANTLGTWDEYKLEANSVAELGRYLVGMGVVSGRGKRSGLRMERPLGVAVEVRDGKIGWLLASFEVPPMLRGLADRIESNP